MNPKLSLALVARCFSGASLASTATVHAPHQHSAAERAAIAAEARDAVRENIRDPLAAAGYGSIQRQDGSQRTREQVRAEAVQAVQANMRDPLAAAGEGTTVPRQPGSTRSRALVQAEAAQAVRDNIRDPIAASGEGAVAVPRHEHPLTDSAQ